MALHGITVFIVALSIFVLSNKSAYGESKFTGHNYAKAVIESCRGCSLNRLPDVKQFIFEDVPHYDRVTFNHIQGAKPELVLYDDNDEIVERLDLAHLTRDECNGLLQSKGFERNLKPNKDEI